MPFRKAKPWGAIKPPVGGQTDWGTALADKKVGHWLLNEGGGKIAQSVGSKSGLMTCQTPADFTSVPGKYGGLTWKGNGAIADGWKTAAPVTTSIGPITMVCDVFWEAAGNEATRFFYNGKDDTNGYGFEIADSAGAASNTVRILFGGIVHGATSFTLSKKVWTQVALTAKGTTWELFKNAVSQGTDTRTPGAPTLDTALYAAFAVGGSIGIITGRIENARIYNRVLTQAELFSLLWQPFADIAPPRRRIISIGAGGGTTYQGDVTESGTLADTIAGLLLLGGAVSESGSSADTIAGALVLTTSNPETLTASDTPAASIVVNGGLSNASNAVDVVSAADVLGGTLGEGGATAQDTVSSVSPIAASNVEAANATDTVAATVTLNAGLAEGANALDVTTCSVAASGTIAEAGSTNDAVSALLAAGATLHEIGTLLDFLSSTAVLNVSIVEAGALIDLVQVLIPNAITAIGANTFRIENRGRVFVIEGRGRVFEVSTR